MKLSRLFFLLFLVCSYSCKNGSERKTKANLQSQKELEEKLIQVNKEFVENESRAIDAYVDTSKFEFKETGTGLRYAVYKEGKGDTAKLGMQAGVQYVLYDLQGREIYRTAANETQIFLIGKDNVESGLHEGIQKMRVGSKAVIILPSHLAHGLSGDNRNIPPQTALVYNIELKSLQ